MKSWKLQCRWLLISYDPYSQAGADINFTNPDTPLVVATTHGLTDCIKYLVKAGADPNIPNSHVSIFGFAFFYLLAFIVLRIFLNQFIYGIGYMSSSTNPIFLFLF
jgi:hypothetical protein